MPDGLTERRTPEAFRDRVAQRVAETDETTVAEVDGVVAGFIMVAGDEAEQVYVDRAYRGTGVAALLLTEAERQIAAAGHDVAWLVVVRGNDRAQAFYATAGLGRRGRPRLPGDRARRGLHLARAGSSPSACAERERPA